MGNFQKKWICALFFVFSIHSVFALQDAHQQAIQDVISGYTDAWNLNEGIGFADGFTDDADFVNIYGMHFSGKAEIESRHQQILQTFLKGTTLEIISTELREVNPGLVIALVRWRVAGFGKSSIKMIGVEKILEGIFTQVFINTGDQWLITASQNTLVPICQIL
jgi:uncharacterized protein (TIGR02246 family)